MVCSVSKEGNYILFNEGGATGASRSECDGKERRVV